MKKLNRATHIRLRMGLFSFSICFEWACQDFSLLKANLGPLCMTHPGIGHLVSCPFLSEGSLRAAPTVSFELKFPLELNSFSDVRK